MTVTHSQITIPVATAKDASKAPLVVMTAAPVIGHMAPNLLIARELVKRGFGVVFLASVEFKEGVEKVGAEHSPLEMAWPEGLFEERGKYPIGLPRFLFDLEKIFLDSMPPRVDALRKLLETVRERDPERPVIVLAETFGLAALPFMYGAPLPKGYSRFPKTIGINVVPLIVNSIDHAPFGPGLPPDASESGRARNKLIADMMQGGPFAPVIAHQAKVLKERCGCTDLPTTFPLDTWMTSFDTHFQLSSPSLEYPRSDLHPSIRFAGALPRKGVDPNYQYPAWWSELKENKALPVESRKKVIAIAQGTVATEYDQLIIPTIKALAPRDDLIVMAILGVKGATLPADLEVPAHTHVIDYLPYDAALEYADLFVTNGGYGSVIHGVVNGVPMVVAGQTEDKSEVSARAEYAGMAVNLRTQLPTVEAIAEGVSKVLTTPSYKARAERLKRENEDMDAFNIITKEILRYAAEE